MQEYKKELEADLDETIRKSVSQWTQVQEFEVIQPKFVQADAGYARIHKD